MYVHNTVYDADFWRPFIMSICGFRVSNVSLKLCTFTPIRTDHYWINWHLNYKVQLTLTLTDIATDGGCPSVSQWKTGVHPYCQPLPTLVDSHWGSSTFWKFHPPLSSLVETHSSTTTTCWLIVSVDWQSFLQIAPIMKLQCFYRNDGRHHRICQSVLEPALLLLFVLLYFHCTTPSSNLVTAVHDDSNLVEIFIFTRKGTSAELDKILPICFCSNPVQSLAELNKCLVEQRSIRCIIPLQMYHPPPSGLNWSTLAKANQAKAQL